MGHIFPLSIEANTLFLISPLSNALLFMIINGPSHLDLTFLGKVLIENYNANFFLFNWKSPWFKSIVIEVLHPLFVNHQYFLCLVPQFMELMPLQ